MAARELPDMPAGPLMELHGQRKRFHIPQGLEILLEEASLEVLRAQPENIYTFLADFIDDKLVQRDFGKLLGSGKDRRKSWEWRRWVGPSVSRSRILSQVNKMTATTSKNGNLKRRLPPTPTVATPIQRTQIMYHKWKVEPQILTATTENLEPFDTPHFQGGEDVDVGPLTFNLEAAVTEGQFSFQVNLISVGSGNAAKLAFKIECLSNDVVFSVLESGDVSLQPGASYDWKNIVSVQDLWNQVKIEVPEYIIQFRTQISIFNIGELPPSQTDQVHNEAPVVAAKKNKSDMLFLDDEIESDLIIRAGDTSFAVHKFMFKDMSHVIFHKTQSSSSGVNVTEIRLDHTDQDTTMAMLCFVYSQELPAHQNLGQVSQLLLLADNLEMSQLKDACFNRLVELAEFKNEERMNEIQNLVEIYGSNVVLKDALDEYNRKNLVTAQEFQVRAHRDDQGDQHRDRHYRDDRREDRLNRNGQYRYGDAKH